MKEIRLTSVVLLLLTGAFTCIYAASGVIKAVTFQSIPSTVTYTSSTNLYHRSTTNASLEAKMVSENILKKNTNGSYSFKVGVVNKNFSTGFSVYHAGDSQATGSYAIAYLTGTVTIRENGTSVGSYGGATTSDVFKIKRIGDTIYYYKNTTLLRKKAIVKSYDMMIQVNLIANGAKLSNPVVDFYPPVKIEAKIEPNRSGESFVSDSGKITLVVTGGVGTYTYYWSDSVTTQNRSLLASEDYTVRVIDSVQDTTFATYNVGYYPDWTYGKYITVNSSGTYTRQTSSPSTGLVISKQINLVNGMAFFFQCDTTYAKPLVFGFHYDYQDTNMVLPKYCVLLQQGILYIVSDKHLVGRYGGFKRFTLLEFLYQDSIVTVYKEGMRLASFLVPEPNVCMAARIGSTSDKIRTVMTSFDVTKASTEINTAYYAALTKSLDGSHYPFTNTINFIYKEKYNENDLHYNVYDWKRNVVLNEGGVSFTSLKNGDNYVSLNATSLAADNYVFETQNVKGEIYKLRFSLAKKVLFPTHTDPTHGGVINVRKYLPD